MKCSLILFATLCLILCALAAGCTSPTQAEIKPVDTTTVPTPPPTRSTSVATVVSTPVAVETLPAEQLCRYSGREAAPGCHDSSGL